MSENVIFCYSGTGNCLDLAKNIAAYLGDTDIIMMRKAPVRTDVRDAKRVGFVFPCHAGGAPMGFLENVRTLQIDPDCYTFGVSQSAAYAGTGLAELNKIVPLDYWRTVTHQCSCIWLFPHTMMMPRMSAEEAQERSEYFGRLIGAEVLGGVKTEKKPPNNPMNAAESKAWPKLAKKKIAQFAVSDACIGCGQCVSLCPRDNIRLENGRAVIGSDCIQCLGCLQYCPQSAISIGSITDKREHYHNPNVSASDLTESLIHID